jgi:hypothetical protein
VKALQRGELWLVDLGLAAKVRPAVVMNIPATDVDRALVTLVPHTTSARGSRFEAAVSVPFLRAGVFDAQNLVIAILANWRRRSWPSWSARWHCGLALRLAAPRGVEVQHSALVT